MVHIEIEQAKSPLRQAERKWKKSDLTIGYQIMKEKKGEWITTINDTQRAFYQETFKDSTICKQLFGLCDELLGKNKQLSMPTKFTKDSPLSMVSPYFRDKIHTIRKDFNDLNMPIDMYIHI
ncbi:hypothetical protein ElyMa_002092500 [Elysia marginata]|uniref:Uncharacterized protein n=1 Tax=Elysia marginata TaxID=1093978 RepID=A0AAV4FE97_9GAST|nr:hypothetical protein ElyMa_002092500 [Elysia marginata]